MSCRVIVVDQNEENNDANEVGDGERFVVGSIGKAQDSSRRECLVNETLIKRTEGNWQFVVSGELHLLEVVGTLLLS